MGKQKKQADQKEFTTGQKRKSFEKYGKTANKRRKETEEKSNMVDNSVLNV